VRVLATLRTADLVVIGLGMALLAAIGVACSRSSKTAGGYFLADRSLPGWAVGFSLMATIVSSMTFLALPAAAYQANWRHLPANAMYLLALPVAWLLFIPLYRSGGLRSAYEYLERRFGLWARLYAGGAFILFHVARMGLILFVASESLQLMLGRREEWVLDAVIVVFGLIVVAYTVLGGLRAVIWTDVLQGVALIGGGLICLPILLGGIPGGLAGLLEVASEHGKMSFGVAAGDVAGHTLGATMLTKLIVFLQILGTDQTTVQRYMAARSRRDANRALWFGGLLTFPVWAYFLFVGTALFVFYRFQLDPVVAELEPEQVFSHFIITRVPAGLAGFVIVGLIAAAMSTLDSSINAIASTLTNDFYHRFRRGESDEDHLGRVGRGVSLTVGAVMIASGLLIHATRTAEGVEDVQTKLLSILGGGLLGLFLLGLLTRRATGRSAATATLATLVLVAGWVWSSTDQAAALFPALHACAPDTFWVGVVANPLLFGVGWAVGRRRLPRGGEGSPPGVERRSGEMSQ
jgi:SSS family solute:Na+ symporter